MAIITYNLLYFFNYLAHIRTFVNLVCFKQFPVALLHKRRTVGALLAAPSKFRPPNFGLGLREPSVYAAKPFLMIKSSKAPTS